MPRVLIIFGTRPEAIKMAPIIKELKNVSDKITLKVCVTAQHREMLDPFLNLFEISPDYDLNIMKTDQDLFDVTINVLQKLKEVLKIEHPDILLVQGDTNTAFAASLAAFYSKIKIGHVEAGLRSGNKYNPFPEEINRRFIDQLADLYFAPTKTAKENLLRERVDKSNIFITGNTVIDALFMILDKAKKNNRLWYLPAIKGNKIILVTGHRRESFGEGLENICKALKQIVELNKDVEIVYPVHSNPNVQKPVDQILGNVNRIHLIKCLDYVHFIELMNKAYLILTDSGGIQEEAPSLGKPVLVMRNTTERPEVIETGAAKLIGTTEDRIVNETQNLLDDIEEYNEMSHSTNPYGDGKAASKIVSILIEKLLVDDR